MNFIPIALSIILLDIIAIWGIKKAFPKFYDLRWKGIRRAFVIQTILSLIIVIIGSVLENRTRDYRAFALYYYLIGILATAYFPKILFALFLLVDWLVAGISRRRRRMNDLFPRQSRRIIARLGCWVGIVFACLVVWGILFGRYNNTVEQVEIIIDDLPPAFNDYKIVHISDIHAGSSAGFVRQFQKAVDLINQQEPNLIVFTGDMVNNFAEEIPSLVPVFAQLNARDGKYAVLGNHDYGGYYEWNNPADSVANHEALEQAFVQMGFVLLKNQSVVVSRYNLDRMALIGIENYGFNERHPKRGDLEKAMDSVQNVPFKVLLSHDPKFWPEKVEGKTDIVLTLSGHTHGMQIGMKLGKKYFGLAPLLGFRYWAGLYQKGNQYLYVNRGLGVIGYPGRVGMWPEITVITLWKDKSFELQ